MNIGIMFINIYCSNPCVIFVGLFTMRSLFNISFKKFYIISENTSQLNLQMRV